MLDGRFKRVIARATVFLHENLDKMFGVYSNIFAAWMKTMILSHIYVI